MIILMTISHELHRMRVNSEINAMNAKNGKGLEATPLPKKFTIKMTAEVQATPAEFADALAEEE